MAPNGHVRVGNAGRLSGCWELKMTLRAAWWGIWWLECATGWLIRRLGVGRTRWHLLRINASIALWRVDVESRLPMCDTPTGHPPAMYLSLLRSSEVRPVSERRKARWYRRAGKRIARRDFRRHGYRPASEIIRWSKVGKGMHEYMVRTPPWAEAWHYSILEWEIEREQRRHGYDRL